MDIRRTINCMIGPVLILVQLSFNCHAQELDSPTGKIILTVSGAIAAHNTSDSDAAGNTVVQEPTVQFDLALLETLGLTSIATETPWTTGTNEFEGVLVRDVLDMVKAEGESVQAVALDDYVVKVPIKDFLDHDVIIATRLKGEPMTVRENGPLWIIYPWSDVPALRRPHYYSRSIWQLKKLVVQP